MRSSSKLCTNIVQPFPLALHTRSYKECLSGVACARPGAGRGLSHTCIPGASKLSIRYERACEMSPFGPLMYKSIRRGSGALAPHRTMQGLLSLVGLDDQSSLSHAARFEELKISFPPSGALHHSSTKSCRPVHSSVWCGVYVSTSRLRERFRAARTGSDQAGEHRRSAIVLTSFESASMQIISESHKDKCIEAADLTGAQEKVRMTCTVNAMEITRAECSGCREEEALGAYADHAKESNA